jgi:hypothetical protein
MSAGSNVARTFQTSNSSSTSTPPPAIEGMLKSMANDLGAYYFNHPTAPPWYPGPTLAPFSPQSQQGLTALFNRGAAGSPVAAAGNRAALSTLQGDQLDLAQNPYLQKAIAYGQQPAIEAFNRQVLPGIASTFEGAGRTPQAGNLAGSATAAASDALARDLAGAATQAGANAYAQERGNQLSTLALVPQLAAQDYADANAMLTAGGALDAKTQQLIDADIARYAYQQTAQPEWIDGLARQLQAIYRGVQTSGSGSASGVTAQAYDNPAALLGSGLSLASLAKLSDRRLKTDVRPVGRLHDGQTVYAYRFRGSPRTELGLLAQEVEKRRPDAVHRHPSGFKMVDYGRATTPRGGLL